MRRALFSVTLITLLSIWMGVAAAGPKETAAQPQVKDFQQGIYKIVQLEREVGSESFSRTIYDNNTVVLESKTIMTMAEPDSLIETSSMTLEEDSHFLIEYASTRSAGKLYQENKIEVYANVADITTVTNGKRNTITRILPTGALCIQGGIAHQLELYLGRYNDDSGGKQSIIIFDPVSKREYTKILEMIGQQEIDIDGEIVPVTEYALLSDKGLEMKLFVDASRRVVQAENPLQRLTFILSREEAK